MKLIFHLVVIVILTLLSQLGGLAWLISIGFKRRLIAFAIAYSILSLSAIWIAPSLGREPLPCFGNGALQMQSNLYCVLNRNYVVPELKQSLLDLSQRMQDAFPGTNTLVLDANFPFFDGFPLLPHLSHDDGRKVDLAFHYRGGPSYLPNKTRSPIGYFAFEEGPSDCPNNLFTLRWNLSWLQPLWPDYQLEEQRMRAALDFLIRDKRVGKIFIESHLKDRLGIVAEKVRFQGCRAARHDDHIHIQL
ncbi:MAG: hypothetical protein AAGF54_00295 [Pseudomonadota bacterium]